MRRRKNKKTNLVLLLLLVLGSLGIGYAFLTQELTINGVGNFTSSSWDVHFANLVPNTNITLAGTDSAATINQTTRTDITYQVTLVKPGDYYEFTVDVVNGGSLDAMVGVITNNLNGNPIGTGNELPAYARYTATYSDGIAIAPNHLLASNSSESFKVRVEYRTDIDPSVLPSTTTPLTFNFGVSYVQADNSSVVRPLLPQEPVSFSTDSWATIVNAVQNGNTSAYHVGDTKTVELGNSLGTHTLRIANTSTPAECSTAGFSQTACGFVLEFADIITLHRMNYYTHGPSLRNAVNSNGGWEYSDMRAYLNSTTYSYTTEDWSESINYSTTGIYSSLPEVLKNAIISTTVVSGHNSNDTANFTTIDNLYLLSIHEVWEDVDENSGIDYYDTAFYNTRQLDYYANLGVTINNSNVIKQYNGSDTLYWFRSVIYNSGAVFFSSYDIEKSLLYAVDIEFGVSPAFRIG